MKKSLTVVILALTMFFTGCNPGEVDVETGISPAAWETVSGSFTREGSSQYSNAVLQMKYLSDDCAMFEFRLMEGSEGDASETLSLSSVLLVGEDGVGRYEVPDEDGEDISITFELSEDGERITVSHRGSFTISPDGVYEFTDSALEVSKASATAIIEFLPTAATSLNHNVGEYTIEYPDEEIEGFYPVLAVFDDTGVVLAKFLVAHDLSSVYRADDDIEPVLIFGTEKP